LSYNGFVAFTSFVRAQPNRIAHNLLQIILLYALYSLLFSNGCFIMTSVSVHDLCFEKQHDSFQKIYYPVGCNFVFPTVTQIWYAKHDTEIFL
jgi:hypothetical protein